MITTPSDTITYYLVAETNDDCESTDSIKIVVNPLPEISITGSTSICPGSQTVLTAQGDVNNNYRWTGPSGMMFTTQTATISTVGTWTVEVLTSSGCLATESVVIDENAQLNTITNVEFYVGDMKKVFNTSFTAMHGQPDVIITDPPRDGMHKDVIEQILNIAPNKVVYVSCNSATQARDLALMDGVYKVTKVQAVDMFPQTFHVENVVLLEKRPELTN